MGNMNIWTTYGLNEKGGEAADRLMSIAMKISEAVKLAGVSQIVVETVLAELQFQVCELPTRSPEFREKHRWVPPES